MTPERWWKQVMISLIVSNKSISGVKGRTKALSIWIPAGVTLGPVLSDTGLLPVPAKVQGFHEVQGVVNCHTDAGEGLY
jgi:hypothetical protein